MTIDLVWSVCARVCVFSGCGAHSGEIMAYQKSSHAEDAERKAVGKSLKIAYIKYTQLSEHVQGT